MFPSTADLSSPAPSQLMTPPPSPRKRRRVLRDSEETSSSISLERYILASDPYRSTSLSDPPPYPLSITFSPELTNVLRPFYSEVREILRNHGFPSSATLEADILS
ncbi:hypothetical protein N7451_001789 [Penicillium sp. IBT 35674x]|nr:hypothetical protein N7451_001789 [Penicillium sp. IBT 35674x]